METWINRLVRLSNGKPFTPLELDRIVVFAESLPERIHTAKRLEDITKTLARQLGDAFAVQAGKWGLPRDPLLNDFINSLTAVAHSLLSDDAQVLEDTIVLPFTKFATAFDIPLQEIGDLYQLMWDQLSRKLDSKSVSLLLPLFTHLIAQFQSGSTDTEMPYTDTVHFHTEKCEI